jgi:hypothetical protein
MNKESKAKIKEAMNACKIESKAISSATNKLIKDLNKTSNDKNMLITTFNKETVNPLNKKIHSLSKKLIKRREMN